MQMYTNKFTIIMSENKSEVIFNFYQETPTPEEGSARITTTSATKIEPVASLVMTGQCAANFVQLLQNLLNEPEQPV